MRHFTSRPTHKLRSRVEFFFNVFEQQSKVENSQHIEVGVLSSDCNKLLIQNIRSDNSNWERDTIKWFVMYAMGSIGITASRDVLHCLRKFCKTVLYWTSCWQMGERCRTNRLYLVFLEISAARWLISDWVRKETGCKVCTSRPTTSRAER